MPTEELLSPAQRQLLDGARRAVLATTAPDGRPRLLPLAFAATETGNHALVIYSALDEKPKSVDDPHDLARVRDLLARPRVSLLVDHWSEEWSELAWLRLEGNASLLEPDEPHQHEEHSSAVALLRSRYPQYATHRLEQRPIVRVEVDRVVGWSAQGSGT